LSLAWAHNGVLASNGRDCARAGKGDWISCDPVEGCSTKKLGERDPVGGNANEVERLPLEGEVLAGQETFRETMETNRSDYGVQTLLSLEGGNQLSAQESIRVEWVIQVIRTYRVSIIQITIQ